MNNISINTLLKLYKAFGIGSSKGYKAYCLLSAGEKPKDDMLLKINKVSDSEINKIIKDCEENKIEILPITSEKYPSVLRNISVPPLVLFIKGKLPDFDNVPTITIVGSRESDDFGIKAAYSLAMRLSKAGFTVVSGGALGCDTAAHKGSLKGKGIPVAVLGCGICYDYLPENRPLRNKIAEKGCLISEYPPFSPTSRYGFPIRNRILAALSYSTVVIEAGEKSGSLITAKHALEQGKYVFAIPENPTNANYKGSNALLRDGAYPLLDSSDIFNVYIPKFADKIDLENAFSKNNESNEKIISKKSILGLSNDAQILYNNIINKKFSADDIVNTNLSSEKILSALTELEFEGLIKMLPGGIYEVI